MTYGPLDIATVRGDLVRWYASNYARSLWHEMGKTMTWGGDEGPKVDADGAQILREQEASRVGGGGLYYVSADMLDLASQAAKTLPHFDIEPEDLPTPTGLMLFDGSLGTSVGYRGELAPRPLVAWGPTLDFSGRRMAAWMSVYSDLGAVEKPPWMPRFNYDGEILWPFGGITQEYGELPEDAQIRGWPAIVKTTWLLMQQPIVTTARPETTRADRRRLERQGVDADAIRVVQLRRRKLVDAQTGEGPSREYHHQWMVRGHWRQQWYPSRNQHRPVWVTPHIKGPEGAPILGGERVHAWTR